LSDSPAFIPDLCAARAPKAGRRESQFDFKEADKMSSSKSVVLPRRLFLTLFSPEQLDLVGMWRESAAGTLKVDGRKGYREQFPHDYKWTKCPYRVLWGAVSCGTHTVKRPEK
jgi:hypothetical protein